VKFSEQPPGFVEKQFDAGGITLNYGEGPNNGPPLVLVHGVGRRWQVFSPLLDALATRWHVFAPDLRGHGKSSHIRDGYNSQQYAVDVAALLQERVRVPAVIFGHSLGGAVGMWIAAHHPQLVRALVVGDTTMTKANFDRSIYPALFRALHAVAKRRGSLDELAEALGGIEMKVPGLDEPVAIRDLPGNDQEALLSWARCVSQVDPDLYMTFVNGSAFEGWDHEYVLQRIKCPTLLLQANPDLGALMSDEEVAQALRFLAQPVHVSFPTLGHALYMQQPAPVLRALNDFLASL
jgi:pimeloyl-ACP methyl ester carboxylesterase